MDTCDRRTDGPTDRVLNNSVTIIICCFNASKRIVPVLKHLQQQKVDPGQQWEIIVVDNASSDNTSDVALKTWQENPVTELKVVREEKPGLMNARHRGVVEAKYDIISFIDDDNWVENSWVKKVSDVFESDKTIGACGGSVEAVFEKDEPHWFPYFKNNYAVGRQADESGVIDNSKGFLWGAGLSFRKSIWEELQRRKYVTLTLDREGNTLSSGGDTELCYAFRLLGYKLYYKDDLSLKHYMPQTRMNFSYLEKMCVGFGKSFVLLNCYRVLLYPDTFKHFFWFYDWLATVTRIARLWVKQLVTGNKLDRLRFKVDIAYWKGYASQVWQNKGGIKKNISVLNSVFYPRE